MKINLAALAQSPVIKSGIAWQVDEQVKEHAEKFAIAFDKYIRIAKTGIDTFSLASDDSSRLLISDEEVVNNYGGRGLYAIICQKLNFINYQHIVLPKPTT
jgi:hypothetical protein